MKKTELLNGDFVVLKSREVGLVIINSDESYIVFENRGWEDLEEYDENLVHTYEDDAVMQIYRGPHGFNELIDEPPVYERDESWIGPIDEAYHEMLVRIENSEAANRQRYAESHKDYISVVSQLFYGNRTSTEIKRDRVDNFLRGQLSEELYGENDVKDVSRKMVHIPGFDNIVIVYDQTQEDKYINEEFPEIYDREAVEHLARYGEELKMHISCHIPELDFTLHTRCFACRVDEQGVLQSLVDGDVENFIEYFPVK